MGRNALKLITCSTCKLDKSVDSFWKRNDIPRGRHYKCADCEMAAALVKKGDKPDGRSLRIVRDKPSCNEDEKKCGTCKEWQPLSSFYNSKSSHDGKGYRCKSCDIIARKKWAADNPERYKESGRWKRIKSIHGITKEQWMSMYYEQKKVCAICKMTQADRGYKGRDLCVDHDHKSRVVRGLLCNGCNRGLGFFEDSSGLLKEAANYLDRN